MSKKGYEADYEASRIQTVISKFKDRQLKQLNKTLEKLEHKTKKLAGQNVYNGLSNKYYPQYKT